MFSTGLAKVPGAFGMGFAEVLGAFGTGLAEVLGAFGAVLTPGRAAGGGRNQCRRFPKISGQTRDSVIVFNVCFVPRDPGTQKINDVHQSIEQLPILGGLGFQKLRIVRGSMLTKYKPVPSRVDPVLNCCCWYGGSLLAIFVRKKSNWWSSWPDKLAGG